MILVDYILSALDTIDIEIIYEGDIDEAICYIDFNDNYIVDTRGLGNEIFRPGKRFAFLEKDYTLLTPECLWYPVTIPPVNIENKFFYNKNYTKFELHVDKGKHETIISQGEKSENKNTVIFKNELPLTGISLCIGKYKDYRLNVDSIEHTLYIAQGHDKFMKIFSHSTKLMPKLIHELHESIKNQENRHFPFKRITLVETPVSFFSFPRLEREECEYVQPEIVFLPENGTGLYKQLKFTKQQFSKNHSEIYAEESTLRILLNQVFTSNHSSIMSPNALTYRFLPITTRTSFWITKNPFSLSPMFNQHINYVFSPDFPYINTILRLIAQKNSIKNHNSIYENPTVMQKVQSYLKKHSLEEALRDPSLPVSLQCQIVYIKSSLLLEQYFQNIASPQELSKFIQDYLNAHPFQKIDFISFDKAFSTQFGQSWIETLPEWYKNTQLPRFIIQNTLFQTIYPKDSEQQNSPPIGHRFYMEVYNDSKTDGVISLISELNRNVQTKNFLVKAKEAKEIALTYPLYSIITVNTIISENIPTQFKIPLYHQSRTTDTMSWIKTIDSLQFLPQEGEIIVDDQSKGFSTYSKQENAPQLQKWLRKKNIKKQYETYPFTFYSTTNLDLWIAMISEHFYGKYIRSGWVKKNGNGTSYAQWSTHLNKGGYYEILAYIPGELNYHVHQANNNSTLQAIEEFEQTYIVTKEKEHKSETTIAFPSSGKRGWISLGHFYLTPGQSTVILTDKGKDGQIICADAMKWVLISPDESVK